MNQEHTYKHVLVALDINDDFQPLLQRAITIARRHNAKLSVLHVDINLRDLYTEMVDIDVETVQRKVLADTKGKLDTILAGVDYPLERSMVMCGDLVEEVNQVVEQVQKYFGSKVYKTTIPRSIRISEAPSYGQPINFYEPKGKGSEAYMDLAIEFVKNNRPHEPKKTRARSKSAPEPAPVKNALED